MQATYSARYDEVPKGLYTRGTGVNCVFRSVVTQASSRPVSREAATGRYWATYKEGLTIPGLVHAEVVVLRLNGHEQDLLMECVFSDKAEGSGAFTVSIRLVQGLTPLKPGVKAEEVVVWHSDEESFVDGKLTTVTRILFPGSMPLSLAWPHAAIIGGPKHVIPPLSRRGPKHVILPLSRSLKLESSSPPSRRFLAKAIDRWVVYIYLSRLSRFVYTIWSPPLRPS